MRAAGLSRVLQIRWPYDRHGRSVVVGLSLLLVSLRWWDRRALTLIPEKEVGEKGGRQRSSAGKVSGRGGCVASPPASAEGDGRTEIMRLWFLSDWLMS
jgi:hypothetical protein